MTKQKKTESIAPKILKTAGQLYLEDGVDPKDIIHFYGKNNVQLKKLDNDDNSYEILMLR